MKCKQCGKDVRGISHWVKEHGAWLKRRRAEAPRKPKPKMLPSKGFDPDAGAYRVLGEDYYNRGAHHCPLCGDLHESLLARRRR